MSTGDYYRFDLHKERARRLSILAQPSRVGRPRYLETADLTDWARITRKAVQRVAQVATLNGVDGADAWKLEATVEDNNFILKGGDNTDDGAKAAWLGGLRALLYRDTDYECTLNAPNEQDLFAIHHRVTSAAVNLITDTASKYTVNALTGYEVHVEGAGDFTVLSNTASTISLSGFTPGDHGFTDASRPYYWVKLKPPFDDATQLVYLDVHIEDWGMEEDSELNHNPRGAPVEWARREVLVQRVYVNQNGASPIVDYVDSSGRKHYVLKIGALVRAAGDDAIDEVIDDNREDQASSAVETSDARKFAHFDVGVDHDGNGTISALQPTNLAERLAREESLLVVGPDGDPGIYTGAAGLLEALALATGAPGSPHTVFLRNGIYIFTGKGTITVPSGWTLVGESKSVFLVLDSAADVGLNIRSGAKVENVYVTCTSAAKPGVLLAGPDTTQGHGSTLSRSVVVATISNSSTPAVLVRGYEDSTTGVITGGSTIRDCQILKLRGLAVQVELRGGDSQPVQSSARASRSNGFSGDVDSYHVHIENCRIYSANQGVAANAFKPDQASLSISTHASVQVRGTLLVGEENPALYVSGSNAAAFRHQVFFSDCTFLGLSRDGSIPESGPPALVSVAYQPFNELALTRVQGGSVIFDSCLWDTFHPGLALVSLSTGPTALLSIADNDPLACQVSSCRFEVSGGTSTSSLATGMSARISGDNSLVEVVGCTSRGVDIGWPKAHFYLENQSSRSVVSISDSSVDAGFRPCAAFFLVGAVSASNIKSTGGIDGSALILSRAQVNAAQSVGLRIDTQNLNGTALNNSLVTKVDGFRASAQCGVGVALLGDDTYKFARAHLSNIVIDGLYDKASTTSMGVLVDRFFGANINGLTLGGIKSCGVYCNVIEVDCSVGDVTVHEVGTVQASSDLPWHSAALVNVIHSRELKFFNRPRAIDVPALMRLAAYYSGGNSDTSASISGFDIQGSSGTNGIQAGRSGAPYYGSLFISGCHMNSVDFGVRVYDSSTAHISGCNLFGFRSAGVYVFNASRVDIAASELFSEVDGSVGVTSAGGFGQLRVSGTRIRSSSSAVYASLGSEVLLDSNRFVSHVPRTVYAADLNRFEMDSTDLVSNATAPKTFNTSNPSLTGCSLICATTTEVRLSDCSMPIGAIVSGCRTVLAKGCDFSTTGIAGVVILPPSTSPTSSQVDLIDCRAFGNASANHAALQSAVWAAPVRVYNPLTGAEKWHGVFRIKGGSYSASKTPGDLLTSIGAPRAAVIRVEALRTTIEQTRISATGSDTAAALVGSMDYIETIDAASSLHRLGVDLFQFRNNEVVSASAGVVIAVLQTGEPHEIRDNLFRAFNNVGEASPDRYCFFITTAQDEDNAFGLGNDYMTRVAYTGNCHMILGNELPSGQLDNPAKSGIVTSYSVCLDAFGNLKREVDVVQISGYFDVFGTADERIGPVETLNSVRRVEYRIDTEGALQPAKLRDQEW
jgi:hypothetical protein